MSIETQELLAALAVWYVDLTDDMVVAAMEHVPGCDHDDMVSAIEAALRTAGRYPPEEPAAPSPRADEK